MEERKMKDLMIDYLEGNLSGELKEFVVKKFENDEKWKKEYEQLKQLMGAMDESPMLEPDASLQQDFNALLQEEIEKAQKPAETKVIKMTPNRVSAKWAAAVAIILVSIIAVLMVNNYRNEQRLTSMETEINQTRQMVIKSLQDQSASARINAVQTSYSIHQADEELLNVLLHTANTDDNATVRIVAIEALSRFADKPYVRSALVNSLKKQDKPIVQITLINLLVKMGEKSAIPSLEDMAESDTVNQTVRDEAKFGIMKLS